MITRNPYYTFDCAFAYYIFANLKKSYKRVYYCNITHTLCIGKKKCRLYTKEIQ